MSDNLKLWKAVEKTDPLHVKPITGKQYRGNSPKPHWIILKATETFGPCGIGWGFSIEERIEDGVKDDKGRFDRMSIAKVKVWYQWHGQRGEVEHIGGTPFSGFRKSGDAYIDEDAVKKSVTDALIKALSLIGFAGDIFLGRYDDSKYVEQTGKEFEEEERQRSPQALAFKQATKAKFLKAAQNGRDYFADFYKTATKEERLSCNSEEDMKLFEKTCKEADAKKELAANGK